MDANDTFPQRAALVGKAVLLVEDNEILQDVAAAMLSSLGARVEIAGDGHHALSIAGARPFELVLMDVRMPGMGGLDAARAIRKLPGYAAVPIVGYTSNSSDASRQACIDAGMDEVVPKPCSSAYELHDRLAPLLSDPAS